MKLTQWMAEQKKMGGGKASPLGILFESLDHGSLETRIYV